MKLSVIMANYNGSEYLSEAMQSVIDQTFEDYEFIIIDDGSNDESPRIISEFSERHPNRVHVILRSENEGQGESFNVGIQKSKGELICFLDSDDLWLPHKLNKMVYYADRYAGANIAMYQHNLLKIINGTKSKASFRSIVMTGDIFGFVKEECVFPLFVPTSGLMFPRTRLAEVLPIPKVFRTCADGYLTRTCFALGDIFSTHECYGYYRVHEGNSVYGNAAHKKTDYRDSLLVPQLNAFYERKGIGFRFPLKTGAKRTWPKPRSNWDRLFDLSARKFARFTLDLSPRVLAQFVRRTFSRRA